MDKFWGICKFLFGFALGKRHDDDNDSDQLPPSVDAETLRQRAQNERCLQDEAYSKSRLCYERGDHAGAKSWSQAGKRHAANVEKFNAEAAELIYGDRNENRGLRELDLHGLHVNEAKRVFRERIAACRKAKVDSLVVIVGRGNHSANGVVKLKPAIASLSQELELPCSVDPRNDGCLIVELARRKERGLFTGIGGCTIS